MHSLLVSRRPTLRSSNPPHVMEQEALSMRKVPSLSSQQEEDTHKTPDVLYHYFRQVRLIFSKVWTGLSDSHDDFGVSSRTVGDCYLKITDQWETLEDLNQAVWWEKTRDQVSGYHEPSLSRICKEGESCSLWSFLLTQSLNLVPVYNVQRVRKRKKYRKDIFLPCVVGGENVHSVLIMDKKGKCCKKKKVPIYNYGGEDETLAGS